MMESAAPGDVVYLLVSKGKCGKHANTQNTEEGFDFEWLPTTFRIDEYA